MQILTTEGFRETNDQEVIEKYARDMLMELERAYNYFRVKLKAAKPFPVQGVGYVIPPLAKEDLELA